MAMSPAVADAMQVTEQISVFNPHFRDLYNSTIIFDGRQSFAKLPKYL